VNRGPAAAGIQAVLLDIEGTTTPIAFVVNVLFPYARRRLPRYIEEHATAPEHQAIFDRLRDEHAADAAAGEAVPVWADAPSSDWCVSLVRYVEWLMDRDRKSSGLKTLQGKIWEEGYRAGELLGEVFEDVPSALARWQNERLQIGIFSSGSVLAQQLLFRYSSAGDLTGFLRWYFDTTTGGKADPDSYRRIAAALALPSEAILFVSDVTRELDAARTAGMECRLSIRPGNQPVAQDHGYAVVRTFDTVG
jgi:enolase-phosphatase E1